MYIFNSEYTKNEGHQPYQLHHFLIKPFFLDMKKYLRILAYDCAHPVIKQLGNNPLNNSFRFTSCLKEYNPT